MRQELHLYRLREGSYREALPDERGRLRSETLGVWFGVEDAGWLRVYTPEGEVLLTHEEAEKARAEAEARARREADARAAAERRLAELEERLRRLSEAAHGE
ncbi:MAG: hypothetical protein HY321_11620 [Armatimonadetes bacterium]|nr:hypothetical protein [Armatimonadota bacterium]